MPSALATLRRDRTKALERMDAIEAASKGRSKTADEQRDFDAAASEIETLDRQIGDAEEALERTAANAVSRADAAQIARLCVEGGVPAMAANLLGEGVSLDEARSRVKSAEQINEMAASARRIDPSLPGDFAAQMIAGGKTVEQVRTELFDRLVARDEATQVHSHHVAKPSPTGDGLGFADSYFAEKRQKRSA